LIQQGDGTWAERLSAGRCPACSSVLKGSKCFVCGLQIGDGVNSMSKDTMPSEWEPTILTTDNEMSKKESMEWSRAVSIIEGVVMEKLEYMTDYGNDYDDEHKETVEKAWNRILKG